MRFLSASHSLKAQKSQENVLASHIFSFSREQFVLSHNTRTKMSGEMPKNPKDLESRLEVKKLDVSSSRLNDSCSLWDYAMRYIQSGDKDSARQCETSSGELKKNEKGNDSKE